MRKGFKAPKQKGEFIPFTGGLDSVSPPVTIPPGCVRSSQNFYEDIAGGYITTAGYEPFNGMPSPSLNTYSILPFSNNGTVAINTTITGITSGATGYVLAIGNTYFVITAVTGTWQAEATTAGGAAIVGPSVVDGAYGKLNAQYSQLAWQYAANNISPVPGTGSILGVAYLKNIVYAFRQSLAGGIGMYKSSSSGWVQVNLGKQISFTNASVAAKDGSVLTQGAVYATINRVVLEHGALGAANSGRFILGSVTGGNFAAGAATFSGIGSVTLAGVQTAITLPNVSNARFEFCIDNFYGQLNTTRLYGCDGANYAFEFDNSGGIDVFVPIYPTLSPPPLHICVHQAHLFLASASSLIISSIGVPYFFDATTSDAAEIACGDKITCFGEQAGSGNTTPAQPVLAVYCRNSTYMLYGSSGVIPGGTTPNPWDLTRFNAVAGAIPYSAQRIGESYVFDDRGITSLSTTQNFGNFIEATISQRFKNWLIPKRTALTDSCISRDKQQYRLFFNDNTALYLTVASDKISAMPMLFSDPVLVSCSQETWGGGAELIYFGSTNGNVFQMDAGTSFNGQSISSYLNLAFNNSKLYRFLKKYFRTTFEITVSGYAEFFGTYALSNGDNTASPPDQFFEQENQSQLTWDSGLTWDSIGFWDGSQLTQTVLSTPGDGQNISVQIISNGNYFAQTRFSGAFIEFQPLRQLR